jgi:nicotinamidase-related amidase
MTTALLVIDVQHALCTGQWAMSDIDAVVDRINGVSQLFRAAGAPVILIQHEEQAPRMIHGSAGWQLYERLETGPEDVRVRKATPDSFHNTDLQGVLEARQVDRLVVCGLQSEFCIDSTLRGALARGYPVTLLADAHATMDNGALSAAQIVAHENVTLGNMGSFGPRVTVVAAATVRL